MIKKICDLIGIDSESAALFEDTYEKICASEEALKILECAKKKMFAGETDFKELLPQIAKLSGAKRHASDMVFWLICAEPLREIYKKEGYSDEHCIDTLKDLAYKNNECIKVCGEPGVATDWFQQFFTLKRFRFGRLQYDIKTWEFEDYNKYLKKDGLVFGCHIPSCGPLHIEAVMDSIKRLYAFAKEKDLLVDGVLPIYTATWLIYTPMIELLPENSNMRKFHDLFDIIENRHRPGNYSENFRIFNKEYDGNPQSLKDLPEDTSLQRTLKKYYLEGGDQGIGVGVILYDGEEIINK